MVEEELEENDRIRSSHGAYSEAPASLLSPPTENLNLDQIGWIRASKCYRAQGFQRLHGIRLNSFVTTVR